MLTSMLPRLTCQNSSQPSDDVGWWLFCNPNFVLFKSCFPWSSSLWLLQHMQTNFISAAGPHYLLFLTLLHVATLTARKPLQIVFLITLFIPSFLSWSLVVQIKQFAHSLTNSHLSIKTYFQTNWLDSKFLHFLSGGIKIAGRVVMTREQLDGLIVLMFIFQT